MPTLNDLLQDKEDSLDQSYTFLKSGARPLFGVLKRTTADIAFLLLKYIDISNPKDVKVMKNKTKNFDPLNGKKHISIKLEKKGGLFGEFIVDKKYFQTFPGKLSILGICCIIGLFGYILLSKNFIEKKVNDAYGKLLSLQEQDKNFEQIKSNISDARFDFIAAYFMYLPYRILFLQKDIQNGNHIILAGKNISDSLLDFIGIYEQTNALIKEKGPENVLYSQLAYNLSPYFKEAEKNLSTTKVSLEKISGINNPEIEEKINKQLQLVDFINSKISLINKNYTTFLNILGHTKEKKYLVVFQNSDEIRPTGGFMGSMGILKIFRGQVKSFESKDVYAYEWNLKKADYTRLTPPEGINKITDSFGLRDSNYFINVGESAKNIKFFMNQAGYEIDGIVFINQNTLLDLLDEIGVVNFYKIGEKISSENFSEIMSLLVEAKIFKQGTLGTPKQVLFDFMKEFYNLIVSEHKYPQIAQVILEHIKSRDIMVYSFTEEEQQLLASLGVSGDINFEQTLDFNYPVYTSISGNKSDRYIKREFQKVIKKNQDCSLATNLKVIQKHTFNKANENYLNAYIKKYEIENPNQALSIQGKGENKEYIRILLPKTAQVVQTPNIEIIPYSQYQSVNFYINTKAKEIQDVSISYTLPNPDCREYSYTFYKQAGIPSYSIFVYDGDKTWQKLNSKKDFYYTPLQ